MKLTPESLKWPQIHAAFCYMFDNKDSINISGDCLEFGVYKGGSLKKICSYITSNLDTMFNNIYPKVYGFDSFCGLPINNDKFPKFAGGEYDARKIYKDPIKSIKDKVKYNNLNLVDGWYSDIEKNLKYDIKEAFLIHIDCDIYLSTKQALDFVFKQNIVRKNTLIAFDEYCIDDNIEEGEAKAYLEIKDQYGFQDLEIFHSIYYDKSNGQKFRQSLFEVLT